jgi:hypothetical protein
LREWGLAIEIAAAYNEVGLRRLGPTDESVGFKMQAPACAGAAATKEVFRSVLISAGILLKIYASTKTIRGF